MRVHLNNLHLLLLVCIEIVFVESDPVQDAKNNEPDIILLDFFFDSVN